MSVPACFHHTVGLRGIIAPKPEGRADALYLDHLPGMSLQALEAGTDPPDQQLAAFYDEAESAAWLRMQQETAALLQGRYRLVRPAMGCAAPRTADPIPVPPAVPGYQGLYLQRDPALAGWPLQLELQTLELHAPEAQPEAMLYLLDAETGALLQTFRFSLVGGMQTLRLDYRALQPLLPPALWLVYATAELTLTALEASNETLPGLWSIPAGFEQRSPWTSVRIPLPAPPIRLQTRLQPSEAALLCLQAPRLLQAWLYLLGAEVLERIVHAPRMNRFTQLAPERLTALAEGYLSRGRTLLSQTLESLPLTEMPGVHRCSPLQAGHALP